MADLQIESNESSGLLRVLSEAKTLDNSYSMLPSFPLNAMNARVAQSNPAGVISSPAGKELIIPLNRNQMWYDTLIKVLITKTGGTLVLTKFYGLHVFERIEIQANSKTIVSFTDSAIQARVAMLPEAARLAILRRALPLDPVTGAVTTANTTSFVTYVPLFSIFFDDIKSALDLNFVEKIQLYCRFNSDAKMGMDTVATNATTTARIYTYITDLSYLDFLRSKNFPVNNFLNILGYNSYTDQPLTVDSAATNISYDIRVKYPVYAMGFALRGTTAALAGTFKPIESWTFSLGGTILFDSMSHSEGNYTSEKRGVSSLSLTGAAGGGGTADLTVTYQRNNWVIIPFCHDLMKWGQNTGTLSFGNLNSPIFNCTFAASAGYELVGVYFHRNFVSISGNNGVIELTQTY
jgi:hypothetical protein